MSRLLILNSHLRKETPQTVFIAHAMYNVQCLGVIMQKCTLASWQVPKRLVFCLSISIYNFFSDRNVSLFLIPPFVSLQHTRLAEKTVPDAHLCVFFVTVPHAVL